MAKGSADYARQTHLPSLWLYGDNDSYFNTDTYRAMSEQYTAAGGQVRLVAFGKFGTDSHSMFGARAGAGIWQPDVSKLLASVGLLSQSLGAYAKFAMSPLMDVPPKMDFAPLDDETSLPQVRETGRAGYKTYLTKPIPRAFAVSPSGAWGWADGGDDPLRRAVDSCNRNGKGQCRLYSVDDLVVWKVQ